MNINKVLLKMDNPISFPFFPYYEVLVIQNTIVYHFRREYYSFFIVLWQFFFASLISRVTERERETERVKE